MGDTDGAALRPVTAGDRIVMLDILRGIAICGILLMNIPAMGMTRESDTPALPARLDADWISYGVQSVLFEGTMRGLFTMLFGAGMLLMLRRAEGPDGHATPIDVWTRRCLALMALGVVQWALFFWPGEILWNYGVTGLLLLAFRTARVRTLWTAGLVIVAALAAVGAYEGKARYDTIAPAPAALAAQAAGRRLTPVQQKALEAVKETREALHPSAAATQKAYARRTHLPDLLAWSWETWSTYNLPWRNVWECLGFMLIGMALFRSGVLTGEAPGATYARLIAFGYGGGLALRLLLLARGVQTGFDLDLARISPVWPTFREASYEVSRLLVTLGHLGLIVTLVRRGVLGRATPLRALGRMALTVYSLQSIVTSALFYGFGLLGRFGFGTLMLIAAAIWVATGAFCLWWLRRHDMGPAERLLRAVAYGTVRGRRRGEAATTLAASPPL